MKQPKKLILSQKKILNEHGLDANDYMLLSEDKTTFTVIHKKNKDEILTFGKIKSTIQTVKSE